MGEKPVNDEKSVTTATIARILTLVQTPSTEREETEVDFVETWIRQHCNLVGPDVSHEIVRGIIRDCVHEHRNKNEIIIRQGEQGDCFYIVIRGKVSVYIHCGVTTDEETNGSPSVKTSQPKEGLSQEKEANSGETRSCFGKFIASGSSGYSFGELALITDDSIRNATAITDEDTDLFVVTRESYSLYLKKFHTEEFRRRRDFVDGSAHFKVWSEIQKKLMHLALKKEQFSFGREVVKQGDTVLGLHFIASGSARLLVQPKLHEKQYPDLLPFVTEPEDSTLLEFPELRRPDCTHPAAGDEDVVEATKVERVHVRRTLGYAAAERRAHSTSLQLCSITSGDLFGDLEVFLGLPTYAHTVHCTSTLTCYFLDLTSFENLILRHAASLQAMKLGLMMKLQNRAASKQGTLIPLLKHLALSSSEALSPKERRLPPLKTSKQLPDPEEEWQHLLTMYERDRGTLILPKERGGLFLKDLMADKARRREAYRRQQRRPIWSCDVKKRQGPSVEEPNADMFPRRTRKKRTKNCDPPKLPPLREENEENHIAIEAKKELDNILLKNRLVVPGHEAGFLDWETSDESLQVLESRMTGYLGRLQQYLGREPLFPNLPQLKRYKLKNECLSVPKPGGRVMIKRRPCGLRSVGFRITDHQCTRYHMLDPERDQERFHRLQTVVGFFMVRALERNGTSIQKKIPK